MEGRGRVSGGALAAFPASGIVRRPDPPSELSEGQASLWVEIVGTKPPEWFQADVLPLLVVYCKAVSEYRRQASVLEGLVPGTKEYSDLCKLVKDQAALMRSLATSMRLTPQSRYTPQAAATANKNTAPSKPWEVRAPRT